VTGADPAPQEILSTEKKVIIGAPAPVVGGLPFHIGTAVLDDRIVIALIVTAPAEDPPLMDGVQGVDDDIDPGDR
jgi:hypothetical protein